VELNLGGPAELRIEFLIEAGGAGSWVTWILWGPEGELDAEDIGRRRYRLNELINGRMRTILFDN
jgi:hypothetical protein